MHHSTCVTHLPWCTSGSPTRGGGETFPAFPTHAQPAILRIWKEANGRRASENFISTKLLKITSSSICWRWIWTLSRYPYQNIMLTFISTRHILNPILLQNRCCKMLFPQILLVCLFFARGWWEGQCPCNAPTRQYSTNSSQLTDHMSSMGTSRYVMRSYFHLGTVFGTERKLWV